MANETPNLSGADLVKLRNDKGLTQGQLADKAGVVVSTIVNMEKGHHAPREKTLSKVLKVLCPKR